MTHWLGLNSQQGKDEHGVKIISTACCNWYQSSPTTLMLRDPMLRFLHGFVSREGLEVPTT